MRFLSRKNMRFLASNLRLFHRARIVPCNVIRSTITTDRELVSILDNVVITEYNTMYPPKFYPLIISYCNANVPSTFSNAFVDFKYNVVGLRMLTLFAHGFIKVIDALKHKSTINPKSEMMLENLKRVMKALTTPHKRMIQINITDHVSLLFLVFINPICIDTKHIECLRALLKANAKNEAKVRNTLAAHYFQPLAYDSQCIVDKGSLVECVNCGHEVHVGDTSMGSPMLWHGRADIVVNKSAIKVALDKEEDQDNDLASREPSTADSPQFANVIDVKLEKTLYSSNAIPQALAEGVVNAFCESKRDKSLFSKFIPSFLTTETNIRIILYNCKLDMLLLSDKLEIWGPEGDLTLNLDTLVLVWMALNFDNLEMNLDDEMIELLKVSNFQTLLGDKVHKYFNDLSKPCPDYYKPRNPEEKLTTPQHDGTWFLATKLDDYYYMKIIETLQNELPNHEN